MLFTSEDPTEEISWAHVFFKALFFLFILYSSFSLLSSPRPWIPIDGVNLLIHELGHLVFAAFGETLSFLGGTLFQLILPFSIFVYFLFRRDYFAVSFTIFWIGDNLINIGNYIKDARSMTLDLVGGGIHDWNFLLGKWGLLNSDSAIGGFVYSLGVIFLLGSLFCMAAIIFRDIAFKLGKN